MFHSESQRPGLFRPWPLAAALLLTAGWLCGCQTPKNSGESPTAGDTVIIGGVTEPEVWAAAVTVFGEQGFEVEMAAKGQMTFGRKSTTWNTVLYGGWPGDGGIWDRVRVGMNPLPDGKFQLFCTAYQVSSRGDAVFEEEKTLGKARTKTYRKLLVEVKNRLVATPAPANP